ncbi:Spy/CpxP family protein refolding chaperone [Rufibacter sp. XAAS-G3-1]|uniref:Spy/CpxP family protein refolding chaperone n=1 Tax=Rufibacter sp. XAAS-G3-1 TaxID=2729134 RepID=UPI0015E748B9|nr:Spy/CpxP family protein refolding chaperone [Rufibacter sp. XAAS-G3-1]
MKFTKLLFLFLLLLAGSASFAQGQKKETPEERKARIEKIETAKIAYITDKVNLTGDQAQRFWPVYQEHDRRRNELRQKSRHFREEKLSNLSDEQIQAGLENRLNIRQRELNMDKEFMDKYLRIISPRQLANFYRAEREFTKLLLERLQTAKK